MTWAWATLAYSHAGEFDWCNIESSWYPYDFDTVEVICVSASVDPGLKCHSDGAAWLERHVMAVTVAFVEGE